MTGVLANDEDLAMAPNDFALIAHLLDRRTYLHCRFLSVVKSYHIYLNAAAANAFFQTKQNRRRYNLGVKTNLAYL